MNEIMELMRRHATVREFTDEAIPAETLDHLIDSGRQAATWKGGQSYSIIVIEDPARRQQVFDIMPLPQARDCAALLFFVGDLTRAEAAMDFRGEDFYPESIESVLIGAVDAALCAQNVALAAEGLGYGTCFLGYVRYFSEEFAELLDLPQYTFPVFGLALGRPAVEPAPKPRLPRDAVVHRERYQRRDAAALTEVVQQADADMREYFGDTPGDSWSQRMALQFAEPQTESSTRLLRAKGWL
ncbi:MAG: nitroreductase family protein [Promicromonosporaceae bacterium]|nr:nitroreductase family protein [Promicromonosporaceae bacterium]